MKELWPERSGCIARVTIMFIAALSHAGAALGADSTNRNEPKTYIGHRLVKDDESNRKSETPPVDFERTISAASAERQEILDAFLQQEEKELAERDRKAAEVESRRVRLQDKRRLASPMDRTGAQPLPESGD